MNTDHPLFETGKGIVGGAKNRTYKSQRGKEGEEVVDTLYAAGHTGSMGNCRIGH